MIFKMCGPLRQSLCTAHTNQQTGNSEEILIFHIIIHPFFVFLTIFKEKKILTTGAVGFSELGSKQKQETVLTSALKKRLVCCSRETRGIKFLQGLKIHYPFFFLFFVQIKNVCFNCFFL